MSHKSVTSPNGEARSLVDSGMRYGLKLSLVLSIAYTILGGLIVALVDYEFARLGTFLIIITFGLPALFFFAIMPAILYGIFTGAIIGIIAKLFKGRISKFIFSGVSTAICISIAILSHYLLGLQIDLSFKPMSSGFWSVGVYESYLFYIGIPTIIYILVGGWGSWQFYSSENLQIANPKSKIKNP